MPDKFQNKYRISPTIWNAPLLTPWQPIKNAYKLSGSSSPLLWREPVPIFREAGGEVKRKVKEPSLKLPPYRFKKKVCCFCCAALGQRQFGMHPVPAMEATSLLHNRPFCCPGIDILRLRSVLSVAEVWASSLCHADFRHPDVTLESGLVLNTNVELFPH